MTIGYLRPTKVVVDCQAIYHNVSEEVKRLDAKTELFAVVKADGYGHGAVKVAEIARKAGATGFCVALLNEALELRQANFTEPILILGIVAPQYAEILVKENLATTAPSIQWLQEVSQFLANSDGTSPLAIHVKIDTGMGRLGFSDKVEMKEAVTYLSTHPEFELEGLYTHFATADSQDTAYFELQKSRFIEARALFPAEIRYVHTSNTATALWHEHWHSNMIRFGIAMYGLNPSGTELEAPYDLQQALSLETELVHVKQVEAHEHVGYGADYESLESEWIGTLPIGYADGLTRSFSGFEVLVAGEKAPIVGRICMDQCMIRLSREIPIGTKVIILGTDGHLFNSVQAAAEHVGTINYEIPCLLSERLPRCYSNQVKPSIL